MPTTLSFDEVRGEERAPEWALLVTALAAILISFLGFFGNLLTIMALPYTRAMRHAATWLVVNLAVAEGIFCITILPLSAAHLLTLYAHGRELFDDKGCSAFVFLRYVNIQAELLSIAAIAINRCVLIAIPKKYPQVFTARKTAAIIAGIWLVSILVMLVPLLEIYGRFEYNHHTEECDFADDEEAQGQAPRKLFLTLGFLLPCLFIIVSYSYIFYKARQSSAKIRRISQGSLGANTKGETPRTTRPVEGLRSRDIRIARTIGVIFLVFLVCCTPVSLVHFLHAKIKMPTLLLLLHPLYWAQYCINIFVYVFMNKQYRDAYINYIARWWPNFREMSRRKFQWKEEATSDNSRRSRAGTPNTNSRFNTKRKLSHTPSVKFASGATSSPATPHTPTSTPNLGDTRL